MWMDGMTDPANASWFPCWTERSVDPSSWSELSPCSRTCGGGVRYRARDCSNPRPAFGGNEWDEQCRLMCLSEGENFIVSRGSQFTDGTRCESDAPAPFGSTAACLRGRCQLFGCDGVLHSGKAHDVCGACAGDGSSCSLTSSSYSGGQAREYVTFISLPVNATQVHIVNRAPVFTHMAVMVGDRYVVAGTGSVSLNTTHPSPLDNGHLRFLLHLTPELLPEREEILLPGPIEQETHIQVYRNYGKEYGEKTSPNISYQFYVPIRMDDANETKPQGKWSVSETPCSVTCGSGMQRSVYTCADESTNGHLEEHHCEPLPSPAPLHTPCQRPACPPRWETGRFAPCSASCGGGDRVRPVRWHVSEPGECSAVCGPGEARRNVLCVRPEGGQEVAVDPGFCPQQAKPSDSERKSSGLVPRSRELPVYVWSPVIGPCSRSCGNGTQQVWFSCVDHRTVLGALESLCEESSKPQPYHEVCNSSPCPPEWKVWGTGPCSVTCNLGVAPRTVACVQSVRGRESAVHDVECQAAVKPASMVPCLVQLCT
ncbi:hypothetical protein CRUP_028834, partial [Coryphaenoides rupestris]